MEYPLLWAKIGKALKEQRPDLLQKIKDSPTAKRRMTL